MNRTTALDLTLRLIERRDEVIAVLTHSVYTVRVKALVDVLKIEMSKSYETNPLAVLLVIKKSGIYDALPDMDKALLQCACLEIIESI